MSEPTSRTIEAGALYKAAEVYSNAQRRGLMPFGKSKFFELVAAGQLPTVKIGGGRSTFVRGADLLALFGDQQ